LFQVGVYKERRTQGREDLLRDNFLWGGMEAQRQGFAVLGRFGQRKCVQGRRQTNWKRTSRKRKGTLIFGGKRGRGGREVVARLQTQKRAIPTEGRRQRREKQAKLKKETKHGTRGGQRAWLKLSPEGDGAPMHAGRSGWGGGVSRRNPTMNWN